SPSKRLRLKSLIPFRIVGRDIPVNSCIAFSPPRPILSRILKRWKSAYPRPVPRSHHSTVIPCCLRALAAPSRASIASRGQMADVCLRPCHTDRLDREERFLREEVLP